MSGKATTANPGPPVVYLAGGPGNSATFLPAVYFAFSKGDTSHPAVIAIAERIAQERQRPIGSAMPFAMDCASGASAELRSRIEQEAKATLLGNTIDFPIPDVCDAWGNLDLGSEFRSPVRTDVPALFISGTLDARTPVANADEVRKAFSNSAQLVIEGAFHSDPLFLSSPEISKAMLEFLKGQRPSISQILLPPLRFLEPN